MAPSVRDLQLTSITASTLEDAGEEERLLSSYDEENPGDLRRVQVGVTGMTCAACSNSVESALTSLNGVVKASVALLQNKADISFNPALVKVCSSLPLFCFLSIRFSLLPSNLIGMP